MTTRGDRWAATIRAEYDLNEAEDLLVTEIAAVIDTIDELPADATVERRQQRTLLSRLLYQLALPSDEDRQALTSKKAARAARVRWNREAV